MPRRWPYCPPRRGRTTFSYMYLLLYQLNLQTRHTAAPAFTSLRRQYKYAGIINTPPPVQIDDFPPLKSRSSVSGPCTRVVSHCPIEIRSGRPDRSGISSSSYPAHAANTVCLPAHAASTVCQPRIEPIASYPPRGSALNHDFR